MKAAPVVLESGDRMSREEFHRLYCQTPAKFRAELVQGVVYVSSPVRAKLHGKPNNAMGGLLFVYANRTEGVEAFNDATVILGPDDEVQPDCCLIRVSPPVPGAVRITEEDYIDGAPQLVVEIAASSKSYDMHDKLESYRRAKVPEYVVWLTIERQIVWLQLENGEYIRVQPNERGVIESSPFPSLRINVVKLLAGDMAGVLAELDSPASG